MASTQLRLHLGAYAPLFALILGLSSGCGKDSSSEKVDAGQRRYCSAPDGGQGGKEVSGEAPAAQVGLDSAIADVALPVEVLPGTPIDTAAPPAIDTRTVDSVPILDSGRDTGDVGGALAIDGAGGVGGAGGAIGTGGSDARLDVNRDVNLGVLADATGDTRDAGDAADLAGPDVADGPSDLALDTQDGPDAPTDLPLETATTPPPPCKLVGYGPWAPKAWVPPKKGNTDTAVLHLGMASAPDGAVWAVGKLNSAFDFGAGTVQYTGGPTDFYYDAFLAKLDPTTGQATAAFDFGSPNGSDRLALSVGVASSGSVGLIGEFAGEIDFTANNSTVLDSNDLQVGVAGTDFLTTGSKAQYYAVFDGASTGTYATPKLAHKVDLGEGTLLGIGSNPTQNAFAICGKTTKAVSKWNAAGATSGLITGGTGVNGAGIAGGGKDIVVAKIDGTTGEVLWGKQFGGAGDQMCESVAIDNNGDVIIAGNYTGSLNFGGATQPGDVPDVANASFAILYLAKLSGTDGTAIAAHAWGGAGRTDAYGLTVDADNNVIVAGNLGVNLDFGGGIATTYLGLTDAFVVKLTSELVPVWAKSFGDSINDQSAKTVAVSSTGDVYIGGFFKGTMGVLGLESFFPESTVPIIQDGGVTIDGGVTTSRSYLKNAAFMAQLAPADGFPVCAHAYARPADSQVNALSVARAATGALADSLMMGGSFASTMTIGSTTLDYGTGDPLSPLTRSFIARVTP